MRRKIYDRLLQWKREKNGSTAILIEGARRTGKSWIAEEFARNEYDSYILIDFSKAPKRVRGWFDEYLEDIPTLLQNIQLHYKKQLTPRKSLIIFDEVQKCPRAREAIKALVENQAPSSPSRKTYRILSFHLRKKVLICIRWTLKNSSGLWGTKS